jgi:pimeloyl-ACP methyl ester carboxylesterase
MGNRLAFVLIVATALLALAATAAAQMDVNGPLVRRWTIQYRAFHGDTRTAVVVLPSWYGPGRNPPIPLVISPHGSGIEPGANASRWGDLPGLGSFAVVNPEGQGAHLELYSWGNPAQISDLARMPTIVQHALPWLHIEPRRVYAVGGSMGGQETLLLVATHPKLLAGAISFDAPTDMAARYLDFRHGIQSLARLEFGTPPRGNLEYWQDRSPIVYARRIAFSGVPLQIWWSTRDQVVHDQAEHSGLLYLRIKRMNPRAHVGQIVGTWPHCAEMYWNTRLPEALRRIGLLP